MAGPVHISFVSDTGPGDWLTPALAPPVLPFRTAVIQNTSVAGCDEMYFDEALWRAVAAFAGRYDPEARVTVLLDFAEYRHALSGPGWVPSLWRRMTGAARPPRQPFPAALEGEVPLAEFLEGWLLEPAEDRGPPPILLARRGGDLVLCVAAEFWNQIGGRSAAYHDSFTYSVFTRQPVGDELQRFLSGHAEAQRWRTVPSR